MPIREELETAPPLAERLRERIRMEGAVTFRDWMEAALYDPRGGYYTRKDIIRWGRSGDYRTAPERSALFSATFANYFARVYADLGSPPRWTIFEAGAGAGHFARGVLETLRLDYPPVYAATRYVIDEASADAAERAAGMLEEFSGRVEFGRPHEAGTPAGEGIVFANELLDAFPVHRVVMLGGRLLELYVGLDDEGKFAWEEREPSTPSLTSYFSGLGVVLSDRQVAEVNLAAEEWLHRAAGSLARGRVVIVDYGAEAADLYGAPHRRVGTLRAFSRHQFADDPLARPGEQDLTTTVDWTYLKRAAEKLGLRTIAFERQADFLLGAGLLELLERATARARSDAEALALRTSVRELILPGGMSDSFQVLVLEKQ